MRGATAYCFTLHIMPFSFQSTLPVRGATAGCVEIASIKKISIHAPRAGSDDASGSTTKTRNAFQSTLPVRGATRQYGVTQGSRTNFNPRSPCGERRRKRGEPKSVCLISIHAPRAGSDRYTFDAQLQEAAFQSTLPVRGATLGYSVFYNVRG